MAVVAVRCSTVAVGTCPISAVSLAPIGIASRSLSKSGLYVGIQPETMPKTKKTENKFLRFSVFSKKQIDLHYYGRQILGRNRQKSEIDSRSKSIL